LDYFTRELERRDEEYASSEEDEEIEQPFDKCNQEIQGKAR